MLFMHKLKPLVIMLSSTAILLHAIHTYGSKLRQIGQQKLAQNNVNGPTQNLPVKILIIHHIP